jgi:HEAT repeat protein
VPSVAALLSDPNEHVRRAALCQLAVIGMPAASTAALVAALLRDKFPHIRAAAALALGAFGNAASPFAVDLMRLRYDRDLCVRSTACKALLRLQMPAELLLFTHANDSGDAEEGIVSDLFRCGVNLDFDPSTGL